VFLDVLFPAGFTSAELLSDLKNVFICAHPLKIKRMAKHTNHLDVTGHPEHLILSPPCLLAVEMDQMHTPRL
jgi:hypothetical protein